MHFGDGFRRIKSLPSHHHPDAALSDNSEFRRFLLDLNLISDELDGEFRSGLEVELLAKFLRENDPARFVECRGHAVANTIFRPHAYPPISKPLFHPMMRSIPFAITLVAALAFTGLTPGQTPLEADAQR